MKNKKRYYMFFIEVRAISQNDHLFVSLERSAIDHHHLRFIRRSFSANGIFDVRTHRRVRMYRVCVHTRATHWLLFVSAPFRV